MIDKHGFWIGSEENHLFDRQLCNAISIIFEKDVIGIVDIGCGDGSYTKFLRDQGFICNGYDGNPETLKITNGVCSIMDFSQPQNISKYDLVLSLEVGEHIPVEYEQIFINNICRASASKIILSWAVEGQSGYGHVNCRNNDYIIKQMADRGFVFNANISSKLRMASTLPWFGNTIMYFEKKQPKVLCFTTSYNRPKMLRSCIQDIANQTFKNAFHIINIAFDTEKIDYNCLLNDFDHQFGIVYNKNANQQINYINAIKSVPNYQDFDLFVKIDDDDIYKSNYIQTIVNYFDSNTVDIASTFISNQLNGHTIYRGHYDNLGNKPEHPDFHMPMTFAFNGMALDLITDITDFYHWEDMIWRDKWTEAGLIHGTVPNDENVIWYIHGKNISTFSFLKS